MVRHVYIAYSVALIYNVGGLSFAVQGMLSPIIAAILMPASSITIVLYAWAASYVESVRLGFPIDDENHSTKWFMHNLDDGQDHNFGQN